MIIYSADIKDFDDEFFNASINNCPEHKMEFLHNSRNLTTKRESILAWSIVSCLCDIDVKKIINNKQGKPFIQDSDKYFSISHSNGKVVVATGKTQVGIDIEFNNIPSDGLIERVLSENEIKVLKNSDDTAVIFTRFWTLRESLTKLKGESIFDNLRNLDFSEFINLDKFSIYDRYFKFFSIDNYSVSVCFEKDDEVVLKKITQVDF